MTKHIPEDQLVRGGSWWPFLGGFVILAGTLLGLSEVSATGELGLLILAGTLGAGVLVEVALYRSSLRGALVRLGFGRPRLRALLLAGAVCAGVLAVYPVFEAVTGMPVRLRSDWLWLLIGIFAFHGLAEELAWRGYVFRRLRAGRGFGGAVLWTMPLIAATHVPVIAGNGVAVGAGAMAVAAVTTIPLAYLYETGGGTIWAPALVHTAIDSFKLVSIPTAAVATFSRDPDRREPARPAPGADRPAARPHPRAGD